MPSVFAAVHPLWRKVPVRRKLYFWITDFAALNCTTELRLIFIMYGYQHKAHHHTFSFFLNSSNIWSISVCQPSCSVRNESGSSCTKEESEISSRSSRIPWNEGRLWGSWFQHSKQKKITFSLDSLVLYINFPVRVRKRLQRQTNLFKLKISLLILFTIYHTILTML